MKIKIYKNDNEYYIFTKVIEGKTIEDCLRKYIITEFGEYDFFDQIVEFFGCETEEDLKEISKEKWFDFLEDDFDGYRNYKDFEYINLIEDVDTREIYYKSRFISGD